MPLPYTPDGSTYHTTPRVLSGDDDQHEASYNVCLGDAYDNIEFVRLGHGADVAAIGATIEHIKDAIPGYRSNWVEANLAAVAQPPAGWERQGVFGPPRWIQTDVSDYPLWIPLAGVIPPIATKMQVASFAVSLIGAAGHGATLPTMPEVYLVSVPRLAENPLAAVTIHGTAAVPQTGTTVALYERPITFSSGFLDPYISYDPARLYFIRVRGESGTNYIPSLRLIAARILVVYDPEL